MNKEQQEKLQKRKKLNLGNYTDKDGEITFCKNFFMAKASDEAPVVKVKGVE